MIVVCVEYGWQHVVVVVDDGKWYRWNVYWLLALWLWLLLDFWYSHSYWWSLLLLRRQRRWIWTSGTMLPITVGWLDSSRDTTSWWRQRGMWWWWSGWSFADALFVVDAGTTAARAHC